MKFNPFHIDPPTLLASLIGGLLPLLVLVILSVVLYDNLADLSVPLTDMIRRDHFDTLQQRCSNLDREIDTRLTQMRKDLQRRFRELAQRGLAAGGEHDPTETPPYSRHIRELCWYFEDDLRFDPRTELDAEERAESIVKTLGESMPAASRDDVLRTLTAIPSGAIDPVGYSYQIEALLYRGDDKVALGRALLEHGNALDRSERRACLEALDWKIDLPQLPSLELVDDGRTPPALAGQAQLGRLGENLFVSMLHPHGGTLTVTLNCSSFVDDALLAIGPPQGSDSPSYRLHQRMPQGETPQRSRLLATRLGHPFAEAWELVREDKPEVLPALQILANMRNLHYLWWAVAAVLGGVAISVGVSIVVSRRVEVSRRKDDFLRLVSHELRTPVTSLRVLAETLSLGRERDEEDRKLILSHLEDEAERLTDLVERVLEFGRSEGGRKQVREVITNPGSLVEEAVRLFQERHEDAGEIVVRTAQEFHPSILDREAVMRVVLNLLSNARKFSGDELIEVTVGEESRFLFIEVRDRGPGIPWRHQRRIFKPFYRGRPSSGPSGFGLGLAYCQQVAESHRGKMRVHSSPGKGASFTLEIPLVLPEKEGDEQHGAHSGR